jgi:hypothetical protein
MREAQRLVSLRLLSEATQELPYALREQALGFAMYVEDGMEEFAAAAGVGDVTDAQTNEVVFLAGLWRLWRTISGQTGLLDLSLDLLNEHGTETIQLGGSTYSRGSIDYQVLVELQAGLREFLLTQQLGSVLFASSVADLIRQVVG